MMSPGFSDAPTSDGQPVLVKRYDGRRFYNTATASYVTPSEIASMARDGQQVVVRDAKTSADITHTVLNVLH